MSICSHKLKDGRDCEVYTAEGSTLCKAHLKARANREKRTAQVENFRGMESLFPTGRMDPIIGSGQQNPIKKSDFAITLNLNKTPEGLADTEKEAFGLLMEYLFGAEGLVDYLRKVEADGSFGTPAPSDILTVMSDSNLELGPQMGRIHVHGLLQVKHRTRLQLDIPALREFIDSVMGYKCHLNVQAIKSGGSVSDWISYMKKKQVDNE